MQQDRRREDEVEDGLRDREVDRPDLRDLDPRLEQELLGGVGLRLVGRQRLRGQRRAPGRAGRRARREAAHHARPAARLALGVRPRRGRARRRRSCRAPRTGSRRARRRRCPRRAAATTSAMIVPHARVRKAMPATATAGVGGRSSTKRLTPHWISRCTRPHDRAQQPGPACPAGRAGRAGRRAISTGHATCRDRQQPVRARRGRSGARAGSPRPPSSPGHRRRNHRTHTR